MSEPAVKEMETRDRECETVHEVERIAGHQVVVDVYLNKGSEESCEEDPVEGLRLLAYDERDEEHVEPDRHLLQKPDSPVAAVFMDEESERDYQGEEVSRPASLKTELSGMLIGKREFPLFGISEFDE